MIISMQSSFTRLVIMIDLIDSNTHPLASLCDVTQSLLVQAGLSAQNPGELEMAYHAHIGARPDERVVVIVSVDDPVGRPWYKVLKANFQFSRILFPSYFCSTNETIRLTIFFVEAIVYFDVSVIHWTICYL